MKRSYGLLTVSGLAAAVMFAGCSDDPAPHSNGGAGTATGGTTTTAAGSSTTAGTTSGGSFGTAGTDVGGTTAAGSGGVPTAGTGTGGTTAGAGGTTAGTGGTGGAPHVIVPTVFLIDNIRLAPKPEAVGGAGGAGGADAGGAPAEGGAAGAGGAAAVAEPDFLLTFDADLGPFKAHSDGFSPNVGGDTAGTPFIFDQTTLIWEAATGNPGGAGKVSIPFSVPNQQADFGGAFAMPVDITGYELTADVKMTATGDAGSCATVFMYVYGGNGYANDKTAEPSMGVTRHLVKGEWTSVRLDLDGPYGYHSTKNHPTFKPTNMVIWGTQFNTFGCP